MKKIIISVIAVLIIASGIICFILYSKDKKLDDSYNIGTVNEKVDIKDNKVSEINQDKTKEQSIDKSSKSTEENTNESKTSQKQPEEKMKKKSLIMVIKVIIIPNRILQW